MSESDYLKIIQSSLQSLTIFLKHSPCDIRINAFNKEILELHHANMDLKFITESWSCAMYVLKYINKSKRGISRLLHDAIEEVKRGNFTIHIQLRHMANKFLNASELSAQEAVHYSISGAKIVDLLDCLVESDSRVEWYKYMEKISDEDCTQF